MGQFLGFVQLGNTLNATILTRDNTNAPQEPSSLPIFRTYGPAGALANGQGSATQQNTGTITGASNASPIVITSNNHGLQTGMKVTVTNVLGNTAADGTFVITNLTTNTFSLNGSTGNGAYTSGGAWHVTGLHQISIACTTANGFASGQTYFLYVTWVISGVTYGDVYSFTVC